MPVRKVAISLAITGHEEEARALSLEAEKAIREQYPLAEVFNPTRLPKMKNWDAYMTVCRTRVGRWADTLVRCDSKHLAMSKGAKEELDIACAKKLNLLVFKKGRLEDA